MENNRKKIFRTKHIFGAEYVISDKTDKRRNNIVGMDGGKYCIEKNDLLNCIESALSRKIRMISPVYQIEENTICWMDVDHLENETIENFQKICSNFLNVRYGEAFDDFYYITKNQSKNRFHIYYPEIILSMQSLKILWDQINHEFKKRTQQKQYPIDTSCSNLRIDGFWRYNGNSYDRDTHYAPYYCSNGNFTLNRKFYEDTYPIKDKTVKCTKISKNFNRNYFDFSQSFNTNNMDTDDDDEFCTKSLNDEQIESLDTTVLSPLEDNTMDGYVSTTTIDTMLSTDFNSQSNSSLNSGPDSSLNSGPNSSLNSQQNSSLDTSFNSRFDKSFDIDGDDNTPKESYHGEDVENLLNTQYASYNQKFMQKNTVKRITIYNKNTKSERVLFDLSKKAIDRYCPFQKTTHHKNNGYYALYPKKGLFERKCWKCEDRFYNLWTDTKTYNGIGGYNEGLDELWTDTDVGKFYVKRNANIIYCEDIRATSKSKNGSFFWFNEENGIWMLDRKDKKLKKHVMNDFRNWVKKLIHQKLRNAKNDEQKKAILQQRRSLNSRMGNSQSIEGIISAIRLEVDIENRDIEFDQNPEYIVSKSKQVWDVAKNKMVIPKKEEYVTDLRKMAIDIKPINAERKKYIEDEIINTIWPVKNERELMLKYYSTTLVGKSIKKFMINLGIIYIFFFFFFTFFF